MLWRFTVTKRCGTYESEGPDELDRYLRSIERKKNVQVYLFAPDGEQLGNPDSRRAPTDVRDFAAKISLSPIPDFQLSTFRAMGAYPYFGARGTYIFCGAVSRQQISATRTDFSTRVLQLLAISLVTGLFCYGLARFLAAPVGKIRVAAQRLGAGRSVGARRTQPLSARPRRTHQIGARLR